MKTREIHTKYQWNIEADSFVVRRDGSMHAKGPVSSLLHGSNHGKRRKPPTFVVDYPKPGRPTLTPDEPKTQ